MLLVDDLRQAWRGLRQAPGFLAVAGSVLALGLGATIFMYGVINTTLLKGPPFEDAERLIGVRGAEPARDVFDDDLQYLDYAELRDQQRTLEDLMGFYTGTMIVSGEGLPERYSGGFVTWNFFGVLRVKPLLGRAFNESDAVPNAAPVVILNYDLWRTRYNRDPGILGRTLRVNSRPSTVIGVAPEGFVFPSREALWIPIVRDPALERRGDEKAIGVVAVGRMKDGVTRMQVADDLGAIAARIAKQHPRTNAGTTTHVVTLATFFVGTEGSSLLYTMFAAVWLVLLIACANVASLIFVRANFRVYEAGMRVALGARRPRLILQVLAESVIVGLVGFAGALVLASVGGYLLEQSFAAMVDSEPPKWWKFTIDANVAAFGGGAALLAALIAGIVPALRASRPDVMRVLRDGGRTGTGLRLSKFTAAMVVVEVALSVALLTGAGLMMRSSLLSLQQDISADVRGFMSGRVGLPEATYSPEAQGRFFERMVAELESEPGVLAAAAATAMPGTGTYKVPYAIDGKVYATRADYPEATSVIVTTGFFEAFRLPIQGRDFNSGDRLDTPGVAVVNETFARKHYGSASALGRRVRVMQDANEPKTLTIVGVVPDVLHDDTWEDGGFFPATIYQPVSQQPWRFLTVAIRTQGDPHAFGRAIRETARRLDGDLAVYWVETLEELQHQFRAPLILLSQIFAIFAAIAMVLAAVGIYGVLSFATGQRNREIGVRRALGARDRQILRTVMHSAGIQLALGLGIGAVLAPMVGRALDDGLQGLPPDDALVYSLVSGVLILSALLASWVPAVRSLRVQPAVALRYE
ncbi:MAG: ABC transporter permease [Gammaproteobacteria bacterium]